MKKLLVCVVSPFVFVSASHALTTSTTFAAISGQAGAYTIDFGATTPINNVTSIVGNVAPGDQIYSGSALGNNFSYTDGALFNNTQLISGIAARPPGSTGNYLSVGNKNSGNGAPSLGPSTLNFSKGVSYFGFLWGSPDSYNQVSFWNGATELASFDGSAIKAAPNGDQTYARFFNVYTVGNEVITKVIFKSNGMAFETDNHAFISSVPEPENYAMLLAGLGLIGAAVKRRKAKQA
jgi:hypothetical protein